MVNSFELSGAIDVETIAAATIFVLMDHEDGCLNHEAIHLIFKIHYFWISI